MVRAKALKGHSVGELARGLGVMVPEENRRAKGFVGQLVELALGADPDAGDLPDFPDLGVELKTIPFSKTGKPAESTFCCSVTMAHADREIWEESRLRLRLRRVLWVPVDGSKVAELGERRFHEPLLWVPDVDQEELLRADWEDLMGAIGAGGNPGARVGQLLQIRPKAANSSVRTLGPSEDGSALTLPLGFYLRPTFTGSLFRSSLTKPSVESISDGG